MNETEFHNLYKVATSRDIEPKEVAEYLISNGLSKNLLIRIWILKFIVKLQCFVQVELGVKKLLLIC